jgi:CelD/BcsL family acetyltransferase involved in cellulose biosynthesis
MYNCAERQPLCTTRIETLTTLAQLERVQPEWAALFLRCPDATPFQSPAWLIPWWRNLGRGELCTFAAWRDARLIALVPLYVYTQPDGMRDVLPVGCATSDYVDVVCEPGCEGGVMDAVFTQLQRRHAAWDRCHFAQIRSGSPLLEAAVPFGWHEARSESEPCPVLRLPAHAEGLESFVPKRMLLNLRYYRRRAERLGPLRFVHASAGNVHALFDVLTKLHGARWSARGEPGVLAATEVCRVHREALPALFDANMLRLYALLIGARIVAGFYGVADPRTGGRVYYYLGAFDPEYRDVSPGTLLIAHALELAVRERASEFDFLRGREPYKYLWGARDRATYRRELRPVRAAA